MSEFAIQPQEVAEGVVLSVRPRIFYFAKRGAVELNMGAIHDVSRKVRVFNNGIKPLQLAFEMSGKRAGGTCGNLRLAVDHMSLGNVNIIPDPDIHVPCVRGLGCDQGSRD